jgi:hypothetical protein
MGLHCHAEGVSYMVVIATLPRRRPPKSCMLNPPLVNSNSTSSLVNLDMSRVDNYLVLVTKCGNHNALEVIGIDFIMISARVP